VYSDECDSTTGQHHNTEEHFSYIDGKDHRELRLPQSAGIEKH